MSIMCFICNVIFKSICNHVLLYYAFVLSALFGLQMQQKYLVNMLYTNKQHCLCLK